MKILITGGAGFIGSHIADRLISDGHEVVVVDNLSTGNIRHIRPECQFYQLDITDVALEEVFAKERPHIVIHHGAQIDVQKSLENPVLDASVNIIGTVNILNCCVKYEVGKVIYASSAAVYGVPQYLPIDENHPVGPISNYGISKHTPEQYLKVYQEMFGLNYTVLRYANVYGPRQGVKGEGGVICIFANKFLAGQAPLIFGDGSQTRDFVYVGDVVKANLVALEKGDGGIFNIGTGVQATVNELFGQFKLLLGGSIEAVYEPPRVGDIRDSVFDISWAMEVMGWQPEWSLEDGLRETVKYYQERD
ncbi:MAG: SDR family oxidoreductase [Thermincolia bacterium]